ncbi:hypothetical protein BDQ17DRAFT_1168135, partial [Cyathus striatus]
KFGQSWMTWWLSIQPQWHVSDTGDLIKFLPSDTCQWETLFRGGPLGLCCVVMSLSWW